MSYSIPAGPKPRPKKWSSHVQPNTNLMEDTKTCSKCKTEHDTACFYKNKSHPDGLQVHCKTCHRTFLSMRRGYIRKRNYGMDEAAFQKAMLNQSGACSICKEPFGDRKMSGPAVDHCHTTGKVRGLLCGSCNLILGHADDSIHVLKSAIEYLEKNNL